MAQAFLFQEHSPPPLLRLVDEDSGVELSNTEDKLESLQDLGVIAVCLLDVTAAGAPAGDFFDEAMPAMHGAGKRADARLSKNSAEKGGPAGPGNKRKRAASPLPASPKEARLAPSSDAPVQAPRVLRRPAAARAQAPRVLKRPAAAGAAGGQISEAKKLVCPSIRFSSGDLSCAAVEKSH